MIDLSHLNEKGFWDVAKLGCAPRGDAFQRARCPHSRNLTDRQLFRDRREPGHGRRHPATAFIRRDVGAATPTRLSRR